jgi:hypothetical protein
MKKIYKITVLLVSLISINKLSSQQIKYYKNTCRIFDKVTDPVESGFIALNDSIILSNYNDSVLVIDLKNSRILKKLDFLIPSNFFDDAGWGLCTPVVPTLREGDKIWLRLKFKDNHTWFGYLKQDLSFTKICRINSGHCLFSKIGNTFYALTNGGSFYNNNSSFKIDFVSGLISFTETGNILNSKQIKNIGGPFNSITNSVMINDSKNIYVGVQVSNNGVPQQITNQIYYGDKIISCSQGGGRSPYIIFKTDTTFNYISSFIYEGTANKILQNSDSLFVFGTGGYVYKKNFGSITSAQGNDYHYKIAIAKSDFSSWSYCTISASGGTGGYYNPFWFNGLNYHDKSGFTYLTFKGTIYFEKPYTSGGGQNFLIGYDNNKCSEMNSITMINSQSDIWANFAESDSFRVVSISKANDFFIGNTRINDGYGIYYFAYGRRGVVDLNSLGNKTNSATHLGAQKFSFGPNPSGGLISFNNYIGNTLVNVYDYSAKKIGTYRISNNGELDLSKLGHGIYMLELPNHKTYKIIIN